MIRYVVAAFLAFCLSGCATTKSNYIPRSEQISVPPIGEVVFSSVGENMVQQGTFTEADGIYLERENNIANYVFSPGFYPKIGEDEKFTFHSFQLGSGLNGLGGLRIGGGLLGPGFNDVSSLRATKGTVQVCVVRNLGQAVCDTEVGYKQQTRQQANPNDFQQTLIYNGRVGDKIRIGYREFSGDIARPAFSNEVEYDISASNQISYRGAVLEIISADNSGIRFKLIKNFNNASR